MNKQKLYSLYSSTHTTCLYGEQGLKDIEQQFSVWKYYFGKTLPQNKEVRILDLGCGNGGFIYFLQCLGFKNVQGIDISEEQIELAHRLGIQNVCLYDIKEFLDGMTDTIDVIFARDVFEHLSKKCNYECFGSNL